MIRVMVAEDMRILRDTLVALLGLENDLEVVAQVGSGDRILPEALEHQPDVAVLDIGLPAVDGLTAAAELHRRLPACRVLILTALGRWPRWRQRITRCRAGRPRFSSATLSVSPPPRSPQSCACPMARSATTWQRR